MTTTTDDRALKDKHRAMWALGNYPAVAHDLIPRLGVEVVQACGIGPGDRVLDVAAGTGNAAIPAARTGASVVASDLTPELLETGRRQADAQGVDLKWEIADAEDLPYADGQFDAVISCVGVMFAPHHEASAAELRRVCRSGGRIALAAWTPDGFIGELFKTMKPYVAPPPPGVQPPPLWGDEQHVLRLFGEHIEEPTLQRRYLRVDQFRTPEAFREYFKANYGPTVAAYRGLADDPARASALDDDIADLARRYDNGDDSTVMEWEYLLFTARRR